MRGRRVKGTRGDNEGANPRLSPTSREALCARHGKHHLHPLPDGARRNTEEITAPVTTSSKQAFVFFSRFSRPASNPCIMLGQTGEFQGPAKMKGEEVR